MLFQSFMFRLLLLLPLGVLLNACCLSICVQQNPILPEMPKVSDSIPVKVLNEKGQ